MYRRPPLFLFLACLLPAPAVQAAAILKCVGPDGTVVMSDPPCPPGFSSQVQRLRPNVLQSDGLRKWADRNPDAPVAGHGRTHDGSGNAAPAATPRAVDSTECENARRAYAFEAGYRYRNAATLEAKRRDVEVSCGGR